MRLCARIFRALSVVRTTKIFNLPFSYRKDEESHVSMRVARSPPPPPLAWVSPNRAPVLQTCGLGRASSDTSMNFRFEVQTCSWKTVIGASYSPVPQSYRCHVILTEPQGSANQIAIDKDLTKDRNLNTFKMYCKQRKSSARFPDRKARHPSGFVCMRAIALLEIMDHGHTKSMHTYHVCSNRSCRAAFIWSKFIASLTSFARAHVIPAHFAIPGTEAMVVDVQAIIARLIALAFCGYLALDILSKLEFFSARCGGVLWLFATSKHFLHTIGNDKAIRLVVWKWQNCLQIIQSCGHEGKTV